MTSSVELPNAIKSLPVLASGDHPALKPGFSAALQAPATEPPRKPCWGSPCCTGTCLKPLPPQ